MMRATCFRVDMIWRLLMAKPFVGKGQVGTNYNAAGQGAGLMSVICQNRIGQIGVLLAYSWMA
jgi:hypothetical protein